MLDWNKLLNSKRRKDIDKEDSGSKTAAGRLEVERDYDRILFSTPVRRLADKTQVFPLEINDSVRTRLTHSHEVSNIARSIGIAIAFDADLIDKSHIPQRTIPSMLAAIGLAHDLGNPPFGHQGEYTIQSWFKENLEVFEDPNITEPMKMDFVNFEGNAQTLRLVTRLQVLNDNYGLNLTYGTLAALMKYPVGTNAIDNGNVATKKHGYFQSEEKIVEEIWEETGLASGVRHPLTFIMESCDDIAYSVVDAEDSVKKGLVSFSDLMSFLKHHENENKVIKNVIEQSTETHQEYRKASLSPSELNDISTQMFRVYSISQMVQDVKKSFIQNYDSIMAGELKQQDLLSKTDSGELYKVLKKFDREHGYQHRSVLEIELQGYQYIRGLMSFLWDAIIDREKTEDLKSGRNNPFSSYTYGRISENYRRVFEQDDGIPIRYKELQLLTDMVSGMTDTFVISLFKELRNFHEITDS